MVIIINRLKWNAQTTKINYHQPLSRIVIITIFTYHNANICLTIRYTPSVIKSDAYILARASLIHATF